MPELPFVQILAENLTPRIRGRRIVSVAIRQPALLMTAAPAPASFAGETLAGARRAGKHLVLDTASGRSLQFHLMRAGRIEVVAPRAGPARSLPKNVSAAIRLDDGSELRLLEHGTEKRARLWLLEAGAALADVAAIGPDPTRGETSEAWLVVALRESSRHVKTFLTDPRTLAGIGNGLADEILWETRLSPYALTDRIPEPAVRALHVAILRVLEAQVAALRERMAGDLPRREPVELYAVHDHAGEPCRRCGTAIARISYADRETFYCPGCQTAGKPLKDRRMSRLLK